MRVAIEQGLGLLAGTLDQVHIQGKTPSPERRNAVLADPQELSGSSNLQVLERDLIPLLGLGQDAKPALPLFGGRGSYEDTGRLLPLPADPTSELMELGQSESMGVLDDEEIRIRNIHPDLYDGGAYEG